MTQLPRLLSELIGWYIWKAKISKLNAYIILNSIHDEYNGGLFVNNINANPNKNKKYGIINAIAVDPINYNGYGGRCINGNFLKIRHFILNKYKDKVAFLPQKYYYTSGSNNQNGFLPKFKDKHNWLLPNIP
jgi:hypothetical protein